VADKLLGEGKLTVPTVVMKELTRDFSAADLKSARSKTEKIAAR
jgi:hypothetical protein